MTPNAINPVIHDAPMEVIEPDEQQWRPGAIFHATGKRVRSLPVTLDKLL